jgi:hypothetical protein
MILTILYSIWRDEFGLAEAIDLTGQRSRLVDPPFLPDVSERGWSLTPQAFKESDRFFCRAPTCAGFTNLIPSV